ncbi:hypothetical protein Ping_1715 [Psychromonas ingrahamii 37]|uniref:Uncharacterized protein n=1 Tax=Psychromonas ingrahamii (strain DSM 17664 / CCUG 51855 / 37) TaxID=357804 RepID=A1SVI6_PSYIN|nr:hypothetical protein Ping_1715 [Psychromonas ingrahamii 37]
MFNRFWQITPQHKLASHSHHCLIEGGTYCRLIIKCSLSAPPSFLNRFDKLARHKQPKASSINHRELGLIKAICTGNFIFNQGINTLLVRHSSSASARHIRTGYLARTQKIFQLLSAQLLFAKRPPIQPHARK